ncbi:MAG TPA: TetR family transcriptional regulator, partial [Egibacteraceae bacterium]|nr:TetR family transcriptional regulator [Egibacteraceae bacterium]
MDAETERARRATPEESTEEILRAAEELLREAPLSALTVGAVMGRTRLGRSSFYVYFRDVDDLVARLSQRLEEQLWEVTARWLDADDPGEGIEQALRALVDVWAQH